MISCIVLSILYFNITLVVSLYGRIALYGALPISLASLIAFESISLNILSLFNNVKFFSVLYVHIIAICILFVVIANNASGYVTLVKRSVSRIRMSSSLLVLSPLLLLIGISAWLYPPNTHDSMVYHMARVAHWIQNHSVSYYHTAIDRQNFMGPGAEYIVLISQLLSGSDKYANLLQYLSMIILCISNLYFLSLLKINKKWHQWINIIIITTPMVVLQASGTKNDIVASVTSLAILISLRKLIIGDFLKSTYVDYIYIGISISSAFLVKPTSLLAVCPVLIIILIIRIYKFFRVSNYAKIFQFLFIIIILNIIISGLDIKRKTVFSLDREEVYSVSNKFSVDRLWNPFIGIGKNIPFDNQYNKILNSIGYNGRIISKDVIRILEDSMGNPYQIIIIIIISSVTLFSFWLILFNKHLLYSWVLSLSPLFSWYIFGLFVKDQVWLTRLQLPLFILLPISFVFLSKIACNRLLINSVATCIFFVFSLVSLSYATVIAVRTPARSIMAGSFWGNQSTQHDYYRIKEHAAVLRMAKEIGCTRIGLVMGGNSIDYPITWQAMKSGMSTKHMRSHLPRSAEEIARVRAWPCIVFADDGVPEHVPNRGTQWLDSGDSHVFLRNLSLDFSQSTTSLFSIKNYPSFKQSVKLHQLDVYPELSGVVVLRASDVDPYIIFPSFDTLGYESAVIRIVLESPCNSNVALYLSDPKTGQYGESSKLWKKIIPGENVLYFFLPSTALQKGLRFDPGEFAGDYVLVDLEVRAIEGSQLINSRE